MSKPRERFFQIMCASQKVWALHNWKNQLEYSLLRFHCLNIIDILEYEGRGWLKHYPSIHMHIVESMQKCSLKVFSSNPTLIWYQLNIQFISIFHLLFNSLPSSATYGFGIVAFDQKLYFVPNDEGTRGQLCKTEVFDLDNPDAGWRITAQMNYHRSQVLINVYSISSYSSHPWIVSSLE